MTVVSTGMMSIMMAVVSYRSNMRNMMGHRSHMVGAVGVNNWGGVVV